LSVHEIPSRANSIILKFVKDKTQISDLFFSAVIVTYHEFENYRIGPCMKYPLKPIL